MPELVHASAVAAGGRAALIRGASGSGKSDLALRCLALAPSRLLPMQAMLISDDYVAIERDGARLLARAPATLSGLIEVRGLGIMRVDCASEAEVTLVVELAAGGEIPRLPDIPATAVYDGIEVPVLKLAPFEPAAPIKLLLALQSGYGMRPGESQA